jgi:Tfp pilus assembly protein PilV
MKKFFSPNGVSLIEALIGISLIGVVAYGFMSSSNLMNQSSSHQEQTDSVGNMVMKNVYRLRAANSETFPTYGRSLLREYFSNGDLIKESTVMDCSELNTKPGQVSVCIKFSSVSDSEVTFSHPEFLKLPQYGQKLYKLDITGEALSSGRKIIKKITVFKR